MWGSWPRGSWRKGIAGRKRRSPPVEGLVCAESGEKEDSGRRGVGEAGASPLAVVTAQNLWQILTFTLSELEFFFRALSQNSTI